MRQNSFFQNQGPFALSKIIELTKAKLYQNQKQLTIIPDHLVFDIATLREAEKENISFFSNNKYKQDFSESKAGFCIATDSAAQLAPADMFVLSVENPYQKFALVSGLFYQTIPYSTKTNISNHAYIAQTAKIGNGVTIMPGAYIGEGVEIGDFCKIYPHVYIDDGVKIADNCVIFHNVTISNAIIGNNAIIHPGAKIGQDGFGFAFENGQYTKIPQIGRVIIGNDVEIGANSCIDRGTIKDTIIADMTKLDNLVQIGHNVAIGKACVIAGQAGVAGSTEIGNYVQMGGQSGTAGHIKIADACQIAGQAGVLSDLEAKSAVFGTPAMPMRKFFKQIAILKKLSNQDA